METYSDIDYEAHLEEKKNIAREFIKRRRNGFKILRPIKEEENDVSHLAYKCIF